MRGGPERYVGLLLSCFGLGLISFFRSSQLLEDVEDVRLDWSSSSLSDKYASAKRESTLFAEYKKGRKRTWFMEKTDITERAVFPPFF
jgi:hypothetical protein